MTQEKAMTETIKFDPFSDRLSRDIRNALSTSLVQCLELNSIQPAEDTAESFRIKTLADAYAEYVATRLDLYRKAIDGIGEGPEEPVTRSMVLWNLGLFFEVHEVLEHAWYEAKDDYKLILQALIRAAGVYIKLEYGYREQAERLAAKALVVLEEHKDTLQTWFMPEPLLTALREISPVPPTLSL